MLRLLVKLLILVTAVGAAIRFGLPARLADALPEKLRERIGLTGSEADALSQYANPEHWPSPGAILEFLDSLPSPWGELASILLILVGIAFALSLAAAVLASLLHMLRWLRDMMI